MNYKTSIIIVFIQLTSLICIGQEYPLKRFYTYGKTPFEIVCLGIPEFEKKEGKIQYQKIFEIQGDKKQLHGIALKYIGEFYKSAKSVIDVNDSESGLIIVKGTLVRPYTRYYRKTDMMNMTLETNHNLLFEIKDNRIRVTIDNLVIRINNSQLTDFEELVEVYESKDGINGNEEDFRVKANLGLPINAVDSDLTAFLNGISTYFEKQIKDDW
uniref:DUF4468 domain-containing protein n=1 Tax=Algoriphagus sp. TaxID=1872435 RepID=UPI004048B0EA